LLLEAREKQAKIQQEKLLKAQEEAETLENIS